MTNSKRVKAFSLVEMMLVVSLFSIASLLIFATLNRGFTQWRLLSGQNSVQSRLSKAWSWLQRDLEKASADHIGIKRVSAAGNGDVVWFLSAEDPGDPDPSTRFRRNPATGEALWQRHIIYYLIRPGSYEQVSNLPAAAIDPDARNDYFATHKMLIRKVVDRPGNPETLMSAGDVDAYTTAPNGFDRSGFASEPGLVSSRIVADKLLSFEAVLTDRTLDVQLRAVNVDRARSKVAVGSTSLKFSPFTVHGQLKLVLNN